MLAVVALAVLLTFVVQKARGETTSVEQTSPAADSVLFERVVLLLRDETATGAKLVVDARALRNDPRLVTLSQVLPQVVPEFVSAHAHQDVLLEDESLRRQRRAILTRLNVTEGDASSHATCPGVLLPPLPDIVERKRRNCPVEAIELAFVAIPRTRGAYWPDNFDERTRYGESTNTVRVIVTRASSAGKLQVSSDYVFVMRDSGTWELRERRVLLIVE
jgi:hypothetical protein